MCIFMETSICYQILLGRREGTYSYLAASNGYLYIIDAGYEFEIRNLNSSKPDYVIKELDLSFSYQSGRMIQYGGYTLVAFRSLGAAIINTDVPEGSYIDNIIDTGGATDVAVSGQYAYIAATDGLRIYRLW